MHLHNTSFRFSLAIFLVGHYCCSCCCYFELKSSVIFISFLFNNAQQAVSAATSCPTKRYISIILFLHFLFFFLLFYFKVLNDIWTFCLSHQRSCNSSSLELRAQLTSKIANQFKYFFWNFASLEFLGQNVKPLVLLLFRL